MTEIVEIYGTQIHLPVPSENDYVEDWGTSDPKEQYWRRPDMPAYFSQVEYDKEGNVLLTPQQRKYAQEEVRRCKEGFFFKSNGRTIWITGKHYFFLTWWKLEDDIYADYRSADRNYFLFLNHWENVPWCLGVIRGKKRREGATSQATSNLVYESIFYKNSFCGLTSKTQIDAKTAFTNMVSFGYRQLPVFLKPKQLNNRDSVTELVFAHKSSDVRGGTGSAIDSDTGHRSKIDYRAPSLNAYDSGRLSRGMFDEGGKWAKEVPFSNFISIVSKTLVKGVKRVGFIECPSTTNSLTAGGEEFKKVWDNANQQKYARTPNRMVKYMTPAYDGYLGFIDKYGDSVIDEPTKEQYDYLVENFAGIGDLTEEDIKKGARQYLIEKRAPLEGVAKEEEIRMNPFDEKEMFMSAGAQSLFAAHAFAMREQMDWLSYNEHNLLESGDLIWENGHPFYREVEWPDGTRRIEVSKLKWVPNPHGAYQKLKDWWPREMNNVFEKNGQFVPNGNYAIRIGCDPFKYDKTKHNRRSNCATYAYQMEDLLNPDDPYNDTFVMRFVGRPPTTDQANEYVLKMAWFCGTQVLFERNVDHWKAWFRHNKVFGFCMWLPGEVEAGIYTDGAGKTIQMICNYTEAYLDKFIKKVYFRTLIGEEAGWLGMMVEDTEKSDEGMCGGFALIAARAKKYSLPSASKTNIEDFMPMRRAG